MKALRLAQGLSQERLAARARLHPNYVGSVERCERNISIDNMTKIAAALSVPLSSLLVTPAKAGR
jgi:transcriptional regulator with XRE-family HTH domain